MKQYSYKNYPVVYEVRILDIDLAMEGFTIARVNNISSNIDYPRLTEYRVGECGFVINDPDGMFAANNDDNFFVLEAIRKARELASDDAEADEAEEYVRGNNSIQNGSKAKVEIKTGFLVNETKHLQTVFVGRIIRLGQHAKDGTIEITCSSELRMIRDQLMEDFGNEKAFHLTEYEIGSGKYPILKSVLPPSKGSLTVSKSVNDDLQNVDSLATEGDLDNANYIFTGEGVEVEGGTIRNPATGYPQAEIKSPYRHKTIRKIISDVLYATNATIEINEIDSVPHFSSNGRVGYDTIGNIGSASNLSWEGRTTDYIIDGNDIFFCHSAEREDPINRSAVIKYDKLTDQYIVVGIFGRGIEIWKIANHTSGLYVLGVDSENIPGTPNYPTFESYDSNNMTHGVKLYVLDPSTGNISEIHTGQFKPQLAHFYSLGYENPRGSEAGYPHWQLPDSRRSFQVYDGNLYFAYTMGSTFGVAAYNITSLVTSVVVSMQSDSHENHMGLGFSISEGMLVGGATYKTTEHSSAVVFRKDLT